MELSTSAINRYKPIPPIISQSSDIKEQDDGKNDIVVQEQGQEQNDNEENENKSDEKETEGIVNTDDKKDRQDDAEKTDGMSKEEEKEKQSKEDYDRKKLEIASRKLDEEGITLDDILDDLNEYATRLYMMSVVNKFSDQDSFHYLAYVHRAFYKFQRLPDTINAFGGHLVSRNFVQFYQKLLRYCVHQNVFNPKFEKHPILLRNLQSSISLVHNLCDKSEKICEKVVSTGLHRDFLEFLEMKTSAPDRKSDSLKEDTIKGFIGTLHNVVRNAQNAREAFRQCKAVEILQPFREASTDQMISCIALMIQSYLVTEAENEKMNSGTDVFEFLVKLLYCSINKEDYNGLSFSPIEVLEALNNLAVNDSNKQRIVDCGALPYYVQLMQPDQTAAVQSEAAHGIWILAFDDSCKEKILKEDGCVKALSSLVEKTDNENVKKNAKGALWILKDEAKTIQSSHRYNKSHVDKEDGHVFISYQWGSKPTILKIRDHLRQAGFTVWIDEDNMYGSVLDAMAEAVEKAFVVLICMSQNYKDSTNCRTEAHYAFRLQKPCVPLRLQQGYYPRGWLGVLAGSELVFDFSQQSKFKSSIKRLIEELNIFTSSTSDVPDGDVVPTNGPVVRTIQSSHEKSSLIKAWKPDDIFNWLDNNNLPNLKQLLVGFDGSDLCELQLMRDQAPDSFFAHLTKEGISWLEQTRFSRALRDLS